MAKKPSGKSSKKPARPKATTTRRTAAPKKATPAKAKAAKYGQAGAPWWKQFLPG